MDLFGGGNKLKKTTKSKKTSTTSKAKKTKTSTKTSTKTRSKSKAKGGNFLGAVGDLVAPTGWGSFATAAGLLALDRVDAALRRGTKEKKEKMKGGTKLKGGEMNCTETVEENKKQRKNNGGVHYVNDYTLCCKKNGDTKCQKQRTFGTNKLNTSSIFPSMRKRIENLFEQDE